MVVEIEATLSRADIEERLVDKAEELPLPTAEEEALLVPPVVAGLANVIGALAAAEGLVSPGRLQVAMSVADATGKLLGEPSLMNMLVLRALSAPLESHAALSTLKPMALGLSASDRAAVMHEVKLLVSADAKSTIAAFAPVLAATLGVPMPDDLRHDVGGIFGAVSFLANARPS